MKNSPMHCKLPSHYSLITFVYSFDTLYTLRFASCDLLYSSSVEYQVIIKI